MMDKILQTKLFHPTIKSASSIPRGLSVANSMLLSLALGVFLNNLYQLRMNIILMVTLTILFSGLMLLFDLNKHNLLCYLILIGVMIAGVIVGKVFHFNYVQVIEKIYNWCLTYDREEINYQRWSGLTVMTGILLISCIITYILHRFRKVKYVLANILPLLLIATVVGKVFIPKITVGVVIFYSLTILVEFCGKVLYKSSNTVDNSIASIYLAPACAIIAMAAVIFPSNPKPIQWTGIKDVIHNVQEQGSIWMTGLEYLFDRTGSVFSVSFSGYSEDNSDELGGEVKISKKTSLIINTQNKSTSRGYLMGSISDSYTGRNWEKTDIVNDYQKEEYDLDFYELLIALTRGQEAGIDITNMVKKRSLNIEYYDIRTRTLFYPLKTSYIKLLKETKLYQTGQGSFLFEKAKGTGFRYEVQYYELNLKGDLFQNMLRSVNSLDNTVSAETLKQVATDIFKYNDFKIDINIEELKKELEDRVSKIKSNYTTLPDSLPDRVKQLAYELTKDYDNDYDKLKALETYLNSLIYSTKVGKTPKGEDFVDYFLFEQQKGYCTYFATAMGILARCIDIPTRYIEGYVIDYKVKDDNYNFRVLNSNAHSWIDAYIEGIGWIPFEPTPAFYDGRYTPWREVKPDLDYNDSTGYTEENLQIPENYQELVNGVKNEYTVVADNTGKIKNALYVVGVVVCVIILFIGIIAAYYGILERKYNNKFKNASNNRKVSFILAEILRYLNKEGFKLLPEDTLLIYAQRIGDTINFNHINFLSVANIFMKVRYGEKEVKEEELQLVMQFCKELRIQLIEKQGKRKMFFDRFLFLHFYQ